MNWIFMTYLSRSWAVPSRKEVWTPGWKTHISTQALAVCSLRAFWKLKRNAPWSLSRGYRSGICGTIRCPWGLEHYAVCPWCSQQCSVHNAGRRRCFLRQPEKQKFIAEIGRSRYFAHERLRHSSSNKMNAFYLIFIKQKKLKNKQSKLLGVFSREKKPSPYKTNLVSERYSDYITWPLCEQRCLIISNVRIWRA